MTLFRSEAVERQSTRLEGDVFVGVPITWQIIGFFLFAVVAAAIVFVALATYPRFEVARGVVQPDLGVAIVLPPAPGTVIDVLVESGESVMPGQTLIAVEAQDFLATGQSASIQIIDALLQQKASVETQIAAARDESAADMRRLEAQIRGLDAEILLIDEQIILQESRVASAAADVEEIRSAVDRGIIVRRDLTARQQFHADAVQQMNQMLQSRSNRASAREEAQRSFELLNARSAEREAQLLARLQELDQNITANERLRAYVLRSPVAGTVSNLSVRVGATLSPETPVAAIIPEGSKLEVELLVPSQAIGFVAEGQEVRLAIDTFPYERFGTVAGTIIDVARTASPTGDGALTYPVRVSLAQDYVSAFGQEQPLVSGMTLTARIVTRDQTLIQWLFEPFYALARR